MRKWLGTQFLIVVAFSVLAFVLWGNVIVFFLSMATVPLIILARLQMIALARDQVRISDLRVVAAFLVWCGIALVVTPYVLTEAFWLIKESFFGLGRFNLFWELGRIAFVVIGVLIIWLSFSVDVWATVRNQHLGVEKLQSSFIAHIGVDTSIWKRMKFTALAILAMFITLGLTLGMGVLLVLLGGYSSVEIFDEPSLMLQHSMLTGGLIFSIFPVYWLTYVWWSKDVLATALVSDQSS